MRKIKVQHNGQEIEIELPDGWVSPDELSEGYVAKPFVAQEVQRRVKSASKGLTKKEDLLASPEFKTEALTAWGIDVSGKKMSDDEIARLTTQIETTKVKPLQDEVAKLKGRIGKTERNALHLQILDAARAAGVMEQWVTPPAEGMPAPIIGMVEHYFGQSDEHDGAWFLKDGDSFAYAAKPTTTNPFKTVAEWLPEFVSNQKNAPVFIGDKRQRVPGQSGGGSGKSTSGSVVVARNDPIAVGNNLEAIASGKANLV